MIPKIIHYCWFGKKPLPELALKCIKSWKKYLPNHEIKEWNEDNFNVELIPYTKEAYKCKKYAFVSDYARFWILYNYGGIYFDTDVELIAPIDTILKTGAFMACENTTEQWKENFPAVAAGLGLASEANNNVFKEILDSYNNNHFIDKDGQLNTTTIVKRVSFLLSKYNLSISPTIQKCENIHIYPPEFFCPLNHLTGELHITNKTVSIHHYMASWLPPPQKKLPELIWEKLHLPNTNFRIRLKQLLKNK